MIDTVNIAVIIPVFFMSSFFLFKHTANNDFVFHFLIINKPVSNPPIGNIYFAEIVSNK